MVGNREHHDPRHGEAGPAEHLAPADPDRVAAVHADVEVTVEVPVALSRGVVVQPAGELDDEVPVLEHRAHPARDIGQHRRDPPSPRDDGAGGQLVAQPVRRRASVLHRARQLRDGIEVGAGRCRHVEHCVLVALAGRGGLPLHPVVDPLEAVDAHARPVSDPSSAVDRQMDDRWSSTAPHARCTHVGVPVWPT